MYSQRRRCVAALMLASIAEEIDLEKGKRRRGKTREWIKRREDRGFYTNIVHELSVEQTATVICYV